MLAFCRSENVKGVRRIRLHHCAYLDDAALERLLLLKDSLRHLEISSCGDVTDDGVVSLGRLRYVNVTLSTSVTIRRTF